jgi:hypothetical protein
MTPRDRWISPPVLPGESTSLNKERDEKQRSTIIVLDQKRELNPTLGFLKKIVSIQHDFE